MGQASSDTSDKPGLTGRGVLIWLLGFFLVVFLANGVMVYTAIDTFSGVQTDDAYRKGRDYNQVLAEARLQSDRGWQVTLEPQVLGAGEGGIATELAVTITGPDGSPINSLDVGALFFRPTQQGVDQSLVLNNVGNGRYQGVVTLPVEGNWEIRVTATPETGPPHFVKKKAWIRS